MIDPEGELHPAETVPAPALGWHLDRAGNLAEVTEGWKWVPVFEHVTIDIGLGTTEVTYDILPGEGSGVIVKVVPDFVRDADYPVPVNDVTFDCI